MIPIDLQHEVVSAISKRMRGYKISDLKIGFDDVDKVLQQEFDIAHEEVVTLVYLTGKFGPNDLNIPLVLHYTGTDKHSAIDSLAFVFEQVVVNTRTGTLK